MDDCPHDRLMLAPRDRDCQRTAESGSEPAAVVLLLTGYSLTRSNRLGLFNVARGID